MSRGGLEIRDVRPDDLGALERLWTSAGRTTGMTLRLDRDDASTALAHIAADADQRLIVGEYDGQVVCCLHLRRGPLTPLHAEMVVHTSFLLVDPAHRKHGFAHALLEVAVAWAEEHGAEHVTAFTTSDRESNRFLARLGLLDVATLRASTTASLRHKLTPSTLRSPSARMRLVAARRSARRLHSATDGVGS